MKKFIVIILALIAIATGVAVGYNMYSQYINKQTESVQNENTAEIIPIAKEDVDSTKVTNKCDFVQKYKDVIATYLPNVENKIYGQYAIKDIDKDGIPELIIKDGVVEANTQYYIYTFKDDNAVLIGSFSGGHSVLYGTDDEYLVVQYAQMGYESISNVYITDGKIRIDCIQDNEDKTQTGYTEIPNELEMTNYGNLTTIENYVTD